MDVGSATLLTSMVFIVVELLGQLFPVMTAREKVAAAVVSGQVAAVLVAHSAWGSTQIVEKVPLSTMNWGSLALVGIVIAALAVIGKQALQTVSNIGSNHSEKP